MTEELPDLDTCSYRHRINQLQALHSRHRALCSDWGFSRRYAILLKPSCSHFYINIWWTSHLVKAHMPSHCCLFRLGLSEPGVREKAVYTTWVCMWAQRIVRNRVKGAWICAPHYTPPPWAWHQWWVFRLKPSSAEHSAFRHISGWVSRGHHRRIMDSSREASGLAKSTSLMALPWGLGGKGEGTGNSHQWTPALMKRKQALKRINHSLLHGYATALRIEWDCVTCVLPCTFVSTFFFFY